MTFADGDAAGFFNQRSLDIAVIVSMKIMNSLFDLIWIPPCPVPYCISQIVQRMGIIAVLLFSTGHLGSEFYVPFWVVITCQFFMGLGTLMGGWRIVHTMGSKITRLTPMQGCCAETGGAWQSNQWAAGHGARRVVRVRCREAAQIRVGGVKLLRRSHLVNGSHGLSAAELHKPLTP